MNAEDILSEEDLEAVREAIEGAEQRTSAEFVCAVATESDRYDRAESIAGLGLGVLLLALVQAGHDNWLVASGSWAPTGGVHLAWQIGSVVVGFVVGSFVASYWHALRRLLVAPDHLRGAVERAGWRVFGMNKLSSTEDRAGVLVYVSLFERKVAVLADGGAREVLGDEIIGELRDIAVDRLKDDRPRATFVDTVERAADALEEELPADERDPDDEIRDRVVQFHPRVRG